MTIDHIGTLVEELLPCPYCGELEEYDIRENTPSPTMNRPFGDVISCDFVHWCKSEGLPRLSIKITGRDRREAIQAWNTRALLHAATQEGV